MADNAACRVRHERSRAVLRAALAIPAAIACLGGRMQMAERALTGELSLAADKGDRDHDCVPDIATAGVSASLAAELVIERK